MNKSETITKLAPALAKAQAEMPVVKMNATNPFLKNKYADLGAVIEASRPILAKNGLAIVQTPVSDGEKIGVTTMLTHESGEWLEDTIYITAANSKGLSDAQNAGVVISYLRRYSWSAFLGLYADEDNDGHQSKPQAKPAQPTGEVPQSKAKPNEVITDSEWEAFTALIGKAQSLNVQLPQYERSKMSASTLNGAKNYITQQIAKKEGK